MPIKPGPGPRAWLAWTGREAIAAGAWLYVLIKLFVFDLDVRFLGRYAPQLLWLLDVKFFILLALVAIAWLALGQSRFLALAAYVVCYPLILVFWRLPIAAFRRWPVVIVFAPALHRAITTFRSTFLLYTMALLAGLVLVVARDRTLVIPAMLALGFFLLTHLYRAFRKAYVSSVFTDLTNFARKFRESVESGGFDSASSTSASASATPVTVSPLTNFYVFPCLAEVVAERVSRVARGRRYDFYLMASWLYTVFVTAVIFAFEYLGLHRLEPAAFRFAQDADFWDFLGFSLGILTTSSVSQVTPALPLASALSYAEVAGSVVILVLLAFTVLTAAREAFREDVEDFTREVRLIGAAFESRAMHLFQLTTVEIEYQLVDKHVDMVKSLRKLRGLSELPLPAPAIAQSTPRAPSAVQQPDEADKASSD